MVWKENLSHHVSQNDTYYGNTNCYFNIWICGILRLTGKKVKIDNNQLTATQ